MLQELLSIHQQSRVNTGTDENLLQPGDIFNERWLVTATLAAWMRSGAQGIGGVLAPLPQPVNRSKVFADMEVRRPTGRRDPAKKMFDPAPKTLRLHGLAGHLAANRSRSEVALDPGWSFVAVVEGILGPSSQERSDRTPVWQKVHWLIDALIRTGHRGQGQV